MLDDFSPSELLLDVENPRFDPTSSQRESINALFSAKETDRSKMIALATDIVATGMLNPTELPIVIQGSSDRFVVIEGNRRIACLKLLQNPELLDDPATRATFEQLASRGTVPASVSCFVAADRDEARHWIELRHTGENAGVGVNPWDTEQRNRFSRKPGQSNKALAFTDDLAKVFAGDEEFEAALSAAKNRGLSNVGRVIGDPRVRNSFGFDLSKDELTLRYRYKEMRIALLRLLSDIASNPVSRFMHVKDRQDYLAEDSLKADLPDVSARLEKPLGVADWIESEVVPATNEADPGAPSAEEESAQPATVGTTSAKVTRQERYIYQSLHPKHLSVRVKDLLKEAHKLSIDHYTETSAILLRVILERAVTDVGTKMKWFTDNLELGKKVTIAIRQLDPNFDQPQGKRDESLHDAYVKSNKGGGGVGILGLHQYVHGGTGASPADVRAYSQSYGPVIAALDAYLGQTA